MNIEVSEVEILENLDWRSTTQTLANGGIRKGEIICSIVGESARRIIEGKTGFTPAALVTGFEDALTKAGAVIMNSR